MNSLLLAIAALSALLAASPAPFAAIQDLSPRDCRANNCLRDVRNTKSMAVRSADCSSFLKYTVTPATSTGYVTATSTGTGQTTVPFTTTVTVTGTASTTSISTTVTVSTSTSTIVVTSTETDTTTKTSTMPFNKRQQTLIPSNIPAYAFSDCDAAAYSSACSCIGVTPTTTTVASPQTIITRSSTTSSTVTVVTTIPTSLTSTLTTSVIVSITTVSSVTPATASSLTITTTTATATFCPQTTRVITDPDATFITFTEYTCTQCRTNGFIGYLPNSPNFDTCLAHCFDDENCITVSYQRSTGNCQAYIGSYAQNSPTPNPDYICASYNGA